MIAPIKRPRPARPEWHVVFLAMLPRIELHARIAFRDFAGDALDEAVQETIVNALAAFVRLVERGRADLAYASVLAGFAVAQIRDGRKVGTRMNVREVLSRYAQQRKQFSVWRLDRYDTEQEQWIEAVVEDHRTPVADQVWFRIDFPEWLSRLASRQRRIARALAVGNSTSDVANQFGISPGRVSQIRRELYQSWRSFHGEDGQAPGSA